MPIYPFLASRLPLNMRTPRPITPQGLRTYPRSRFPTGRTHQRTPLYRLAQCLRHHARGDSTGISPRWTQGPPAPSRAGTAPDCGSGVGLHPAPADNDYGNGIRFHFGQALHHHACADRIRTACMRLFASDAGQCTSQANARPGGLSAGSTATTAPRRQRTAGQRMAQCFPLVATAGRRPSAAASAGPQSASAPPGCRGAMRQAGRTESPD